MAKKEINKDLVLSRLDLWDDLESFFKYIELQPDKEEALKKCLWLGYIKHTD